MNNVPLVSVIVPAYNVEKYLKQCLDSILAQTLREIEIICVNDGSTDDTRRILEEYARHDSRIRVLHQENQGVSAARNAGLAMARAAYIGFVDSDDWVEPEAYAKALEYMQADTELDMVCWAVNNVVINDDIAFSKKGQAVISPFVTEGKHFLSNNIIAEIWCVVWNKLYKSEIIKQFSIVFPHDLTSSEDKVFWFKYAGASRYGYFLDLPFYNYRRGRDASIVTKLKINKPVVYKDELYAFQKIYNYYSLNMPDRKGALSNILNKVIEMTLRNSKNEKDAMDELQIFFGYYQGKLADNEAHSLKYLRHGKKYVRTNPLQWWERIFSVKNVHSSKVFCFLCLEFAIDRMVFKGYSRKIRQFFTKTKNKK